MKKTVRAILIIALLFVFCFAASGCRMFKKSVSFNGIYAAQDKEDLLSRELIFKGTVLEQGNSAMTNPDNSRLDKYGYQVMNEMVTDYTVRVEKLYAGDYAEDTICLKVANGYGLTPDLILYGEDKTSYLEEPLVLDELEVGKTYLFTLSDPVTTERGELEQFCGYYTSDSSAFEMDEQGVCKNAQGITFNAAEIEQEIAAAVALQEEKAK